MSEIEKTTEEFDEETKSSLLTTNKWMLFVAIALSILSAYALIGSIFMSLKGGSKRQFFWILLIIIPVYFMFCAVKSTKKWLSTGTRDDLRKSIQDNQLMWRCIGLTTLLVILYVTFCIIVPYIF